MKKKLRVERERHYKPYHGLLSAARGALEDAEEERPGYFYFQMTAILLSALALEAIVNSFGEHLIDDWEDFESARPIAKVRLVAQKLGVTYRKSDRPWSSLPWLIRVRNALVHARPQAVYFDKEMSEEEFARIQLSPPPSKVELEITIGNARLAVKEVGAILEQFASALSWEDRVAFLSDGWSGTCG